MEHQLMDEQRHIEEQKNMADEEKQRLLAAIEEKRRQTEEEAMAQARMLQQLKQMEDKMLVGTQVMEKAMQQEHELRRAQMEVEEKMRAEQRMREELEQQMEEKLNLEEKYASAEDQVQKMTAKLEKLWNRHKETQQDIQDLQKEFQGEREDMLETIRELRKEVKLVCLTIESFIPMEHYQQIVERAQYDESSDEWIINNIDLAGNRVRPHRKRTERDADSPGSLLRTGLGGDGGQADIPLVPERPNVYFVYTEDGGAQRAEARPAASPQSQRQKNQRVKSASRPTTASRKGRAVKAGPVGNQALTMSNFLHSLDPAEEGVMVGVPYPKARGLVRAE